MKKYETISFETTPEIKQFIRNESKRQKLSMSCWTIALMFMMILRDPKLESQHKDAMDILFDLIRRGGKTT